MTITNYTIFLEVRIRIDRKEKYVIVGSFSIQFIIVPFEMFGTLKFFLGGGGGEEGKYDMATLNGVVLLSLNNVRMQLRLK